MSAIRAGEAVSEENELAFKAIFEGALDAMLIADDSGAYLAANGAAGALLGRPPEALIGRRLSEFVQPHFDDRFAALLARDGVTATIVLDGPGGEMRLAELSTTPNILPGRHLSVLRDVTERVEADRAQRESESKFRSIFDHNHSAIVLFDDDQSWLEVNLAAAELVGLPRAELIGKRFAALGEPGPEFESVMADFLRLGKLEGDWTVVRPDGERRSAEIALRANVVPGRHLAVIRDVTEARRVDEQLRQSQKLEAVGQLAGGIAHDFNNFLTAIAGFSDLALNEIDSGGSGARRNVEEIRRAADRAAQLTHQLLAFSRRQVLQQERLNLNEIIGEYAPMLTRILGEQISVRVDLDLEPLPVLGDRGRLGQVIINLAVNARDAMPDGGTLTLRTHRDGGEHPAAVLTVTDTGEGIDEHTRARLFEPFFTTRPTGKGTGLGLATVLGIVEQSGGTVAVHSTVGSGSAFTVALPLVAGATVGLPARPEARDWNGSERVLVVEDDPSLGRMVKSMLDARGYQIVVADTPHRALALAAREAEFDLVVTDVVMPEMNGRELAERLTDEHPGLRVLFTSGYNEDELLARGVIDATFRFLPKPFSVDQLARQVRLALDAPHGRAPVTGDGASAGDEILQLPLN